MPVRFTGIPGAGGIGMSRICKARLIALPAVALLSLLAPSADWRAAADDGFNDQFKLPFENFAPTGRNRYFILEPGYQQIFEGQTDGKAGQLVITVLNDMKMLAGVETRVVEERESADGKLIEVSRNYFAVDKATSDIYHFGEDVDIYKNGRVASHEGSWRAGEDGARWGLFMPAEPKVGQKFQQEIAPKVAMDRVEVQSVSEKVSVPAGNFEGCVKTEETTPLKPNTKEHKYYAPEVGLLIDGDLKLVKHTAPGEKAAAKPAARADPAAADAQNAKQPAATRPAQDEPPLARQALALVGVDPLAEAVWVDAINDPDRSAHERQDLIEDLNEEGFADPAHPSPDELAMITSRLAMIEQLAPDAMDEVNLAAFAEAYKDLANMYERAAGGQ
jgi:hypothetical protein